MIESNTKLLRSYIREFRITGLSLDREFIGNLRRNFSKFVDKFDEKALDYVSGKSGSKSLKVQGKKENSEKFLSKLKTFISKSDLDDNQKRLAQAVAISKYNELLENNETEDYASVEAFRHLKSKYEQIKKWVDDPRSSR